MKKLILITLLALSTSLSAQINFSATAIKSETPELYADIRSSAIQEWSNDHSMVLYEINKQADAFRELRVLHLHAPSNWRILNYALEEWGTDKSHNRTVMSKDGWKMEHCRADWSMVKYEYEKQVKAKRSY